MGPETMMAFLAWSAISGPLMGGNSYVLGLDDNVAYLLHGTLKAMGLEPGPLDKFLGWDSKRVLEPWDSTFRVAGNLFSVQEEFARKIVLRDFGQTPSPRAEEPAFEENAAITVAEGPAPAQGELWGAATWYLNRGDAPFAQGYGMSFNYPSKAEAIAAAMELCERKQPPHPKDNTYHVRCGRKITAFSTNAEGSNILVGGVRTLTWSRRCMYAAKETDKNNNLPFEFSYGITDDPDGFTASYYNRRFNEGVVGTIDAMACNDR